MTKNINLSQWMSHRTFNGFCRMCVRNIESLLCELGPSQTSLERMAAPYDDPEVSWLEEEKKETTFKIYIRYAIPKATRAKERIDTRQTFS